MVEVEEEGERKGVSNGSIGTSYAMDMQRVFHVVLVRVGERGEGVFWEAYFTSKYQLLYSQIILERML